MLKVNKRIEVTIMQIKGMPLIKFQNEDRIESLQKGKIYMKCLDWYREYENSNNDIIGDSYEAMLHLCDAKVIIPEMNIDEKIEDGLLKTSYSNDFVFCMFSINNHDNSFEFSELQKQEILTFGDTALIITDTNEFLRRIYETIKNTGYEVYCNYINYFDEQTNSFQLIKSLIEGMHNIAFWKRKKYSYQQEFRILLHGANIDQDFIELDIGDISDISKLCKTSTLLNSKIVKI